MKMMALAWSLAAVSAFLSCFISADEANAPQPEKGGTASVPAGKPAFRVFVGPGYSVCEAYARNLNTLASSASESPVTCKLPVHPSFSAFKKPDWEDLDINSNLRLIHAAELLLKDWLVPRHHPSPEFDEWVSTYQHQVDTGEFHPQLRRTRLALNERGIETLIWYQHDRRECERSKGALGFGPGGHIFVLRDDAEQPLEYIQGSVGSHSETEILIYRDKPFFFMSGWTPPEDRWWLGVNTVFSRTKPVVGGHHERYVLNPRCEIELRK